MGNGLFSNLGLDVAGLIAETVGPSLLPLTLHKPGTPGGRDPLDPTKVLDPAPGSSHAGRGIIEDFDPKTIDGTLIKIGDRKVLLIAETLRPTAVPEEADQITIEGTRYAVHRIISRDPAAASYVLQVRSSPST